MIYRNFKLNIILRVLVIMTLSIALAFVTVTQPMLFVPAFIVLVLVAAVINLIQYINKSSRDLTHFLLSIREGAYTETYTSGKRGKPFEDVSDALNEVVNEFAKLNIEKELHYQYL